MIHAGVEISKQFGFNDSAVATMGLTYSQNDCYICPVPRAGHFYVLVISARVSAAPKLVMRSILSETFGLSRLNYVV